MTKNQPCLRCAGKICWRCYLESNRHLARVTFSLRLRLRSVDLERLKGEFGICIWLTFFFGSSKHDKQTFDICIAIREMWGHACSMEILHLRWMQPPNHTSTSKHNLHDRLWRYRSDHVTPQSLPVDGFTDSSSYGVMWGK